MRRALAFLTPFGGGATPTARTLSWFPLAGAFIGLVLGAIWWEAARRWPSTVAAAVVVALDLLLTGMLHVDGLADSADGLIAPMDRAHRLTVMAEPSTGAFGVATVAVVLLLRFAALSTIAAAPLLLAGLWCLSRTSMAVIARTMPYARDDGLASAFLGGSPWPTAALARRSRSAWPSPGAGSSPIGGSPPSRSSRARSPPRSWPRWPTAGSGGSPATCSARPAPSPRRWACSCWPPGSRDGDRVTGW